MFIFGNTRLSEVEANLFFSRSYVCTWTTPVNGLCLVAFSFVATSRMYSDPNDTPDS